MLDHLRRGVGALYSQNMLTLAITFLDSSGIFLVVFYGKEHWKEKGYCIDSSLYLCDNSEVSWGGLCSGGGGITIGSATEMCGTGHQSSRRGHRIHYIQLTVEVTAQITSSWPFSLDSGLLTSVTFRPGLCGPSNWGIPAVPIQAEEDLFWRIASLPCKDINHGAYSQKMSDITRANISAPIHQQKRIKAIELNPWMKHQWRQRIKQRTASIQKLLPAHTTTITIHAGRYCNIFWVIGSFLV